MRRLIFIAVILGAAGWLGFDGWADVDQGMDFGALHRAFMGFSKLALATCLTILARVLCA